MDKKQYFNFIKELEKLFSPYKFYFISETAYKISKKKTPDIFFTVSNIDTIKLYSNFDKVTHLKFSSFDYYINFSNKIIFLKHFDLKKSNTKDYLIDFAKSNKDPFIINLFYDPILEIFYDFNSILHYLNNKLLFLRQLDSDNILKSIILANNLSIKSVIYENDNILKKIDFNINYKFNEAISDENLKEFPLHQFFNLFYFSITGSGKYKNLILLDRLKLLNYFIPELDKLKNVNQNKDHHPEGNAFEHSLLTVKNIESNDFALNLAALFHDLGKFKTEVKKKLQNEAKFPFHSRIGANIARNILQRWKTYLDFYPEIELKISFLIENHMNIGFIYNLDFNKQKKILNSIYLPDLLKLFKADAKSSYRSLDRYKKVLSYIRSKSKYIKN